MVRPARVLSRLLYELLAGSPPIDAKEFKRGAILEMLRMVREVDPPKPSTKVSTSDALPSIAAGRGIDPSQLKRALAGDLDWIVMKALEKDRTRRYATATGFGADILRHLASEPVLAAPASRAYRVRKFVRKHRVGVIAASLVLLALTGGIIGTSFGLIQANKSAAAERLAKQEADAKRAEAQKQQRRAGAGEKLAGERLVQVEAEKKALQEQKIRAEAGEKLAGERLVQVEAEKKKAEEEKQIAVAVRDFLQNKLLSQANLTAQADALLAAGGSAAARKDPTIRELLDRAAEELSEAKIGANFPNQPLLQAEILTTVGTTYHGVGDSERAIGFLQRSVALRKAKLGPEHLDTLISMNNLALAYVDAGKVDLALPLFEETLKLVKAKLGPEHPSTLASMAFLGSLLLEKESFTDAEPLLRECLAIRDKKETDGWTRFDTQSLLGGAQKKYAEAEPLLVRGYEGMKQREKSIPANGLVRLSQALDRLIEL